MKIFLIEVSHGNARITLSNFFLNEEMCDQEIVFLQKKRVHV